MFEEKYRKDNEKIEPTQESMLSLSYKMKREAAQKTGKRRAASWIRTGAAVMAALVLLAGSFFALQFLLPHSPGGIPNVKPEAEMIPMEGAGGAGEEQPLESDTLKRAQKSGDYTEIFTTITALREKEKQQNTADGHPPATGIVAETEEAIGADEGAVPGDAAVGADDAAPEAGNSVSENKEYSDTNLQVAGVQEADIIKTDGKYIYAVADLHVYILEENDGQPKIVSQIDKSPAEDTEPFKAEVLIRDMYVAGDRLVLRTYVRNHDLYWEDEGPYAEKRYLPAGHVGNDVIEVYDISDRAQPVLLNQLGQSGDIISSRMVGNILYLVSSCYVWDEIQEEEPSTFVPSLASGEKTEPVTADCIYLLPEPEGTQYLVVSSVDVTDPVDFLDSKAVLGCGSEIYCNADNLFVALVTSETVNNVWKNKTQLYRFSLTDGVIALEAEGSVPGSILNQFSMDEHDGHLRLVTTENVTHYINEGMYSSAIAEKSKNHLFILNSELEQVGSLEDLARNEQIYSARFMGDTGYFVTFRQVDPLFAVDLSDPDDPEILSELKLPGFSNYLHPFGKNLLLGFGQDADEKTGITQGLKLSMFDTSDLSAVYEKDSLLLGEQYMWSDALYNHKAFFADAEKGLIGFPAEDQYLVYQYSPRSGFRQIACLTLEEAGSGEYDYDLRGFYIGDVFYLYGHRGLAAFRLKDFSRISTLLWEVDPHAWLGMIAE